MTAILALETGEILHGQSIGVSGLVCGEIIFNTGMTGYQEIITDPSYRNQIINFTYPHIGNVGVNKKDFESDRVWASGIIVKELSPYCSNWRAENSLHNFLQEFKVVGIQGIDTRYITRKIRQHGYLNAAIMSGYIDESKAVAAVNNFPGLKGSCLIDGVGVNKITKIENTKNSICNYNIAVVDFGVKNSILSVLKNLGCNIYLFPFNSDIESILAVNPDGVLLSNGPGDPDSCLQEIAMIQKLITYGLPIMGICLGFQLLALAFGAKTEKMLFGHHGINHPIQDVYTKKVFITSQNHGFSVVEKTLPEKILPTHYSLFDNSLQGFAHKSLPIFGLQGHPEAGPGPSDATELFQYFLNDIKVYQRKNKNCKIALCEKIASCVK